MGLQRIVLASKSLTSTSGFFVFQWPLTLSVNIMASHKFGTLRQSRTELKSN